MSGRFEVAYSDSGKLIYITDLVTNLQWSGDTGQAARKLQIEHLSKARIPHGALITVFHDGEVFMQALEKKFTVKAGSESVQVLAYDFMFQLLNSTDSRVFRGMTAKQIIADICTAAGVPMGYLEETGYVFDFLPLTEKTLYDMCLIAVTETTKATGKKYILKVKQGKACLFERVKQLHQFVLESGGNLTEAAYSESIEAVRDKVQLMGKDKAGNEILSTAQDAGLIRQYGILQEYAKHEQAVSKGELDAIAQQMLQDLSAVQKNASVEAVGICGVEAGDAVFIVEPVTGLTGSYFVDSDQHTVQNGQHTMSLNLTWTDKLPALEYEKPEGD